MLKRASSGQSHQKEHVEIDDRLPSRRETVLKPGGEASSG